MKHKYLYTLLCLFILIIYNKNCKAQLFCTNQTNKDVWLSIAYNHLPDEAANASENIWVTEGWIYVAPNDTLQLTSHMGYKRGHGVKTLFFYNAYQPDGREWTGPRKFLVDPNPTDVEPHKFDFKIEYANNADLYKDRPNLKFVQFKAASFYGDENRQYLITLRNDDENDPPMTRKDKEYWFGAPPELPYPADELTPHKLNSSDELTEVKETY